MNENACWVIVAAGQGKRLLPLTENSPKALVKVHDRPLFLFSLACMIRAGIRDIGIVIQPQFRDDFQRVLEEKNFNAKITLIDQPDALGMAYAVWLAREFVQNRVCMVLAGDSVNNFDFTQALTWFETWASIFARRETDVTIQKASGVVEMDETGKVIRITEKPDIPASDLLQIGGGIYDATLFKRIWNLPISPRGEYEITGVNNSYLWDGVLACTDMGKTYYNNVTFPADVDAASEYVRTHSDEF